MHTESNIVNADTVNQLKDFFADSAPITEVDFAKNEEVIIPKDKCDTEGLKEYSYAYAFVTTSMSPKLCTAKHFVTKNEDGDSDPGNGNYRNIQEHFVGNYAKIEDAQKHSVSYNFMEILLVWKVLNPTAVNLYNKYGDETINLFKAWSDVNLQQVKDWPADVNSQGGNDNL